MRPKNMRQFLATAFKNKRQVLLTGIPGVGKSDIIDGAALDAQADVITKHPAVEDPTDSKGLPGLVNGKAEWLPFGDLRKLIDADKLTVCHLEDFGQASVAVQAGYMQMLLRRAINGCKISDHVVFVASTNDTTHMSGVGGLIEPVKSRFHTIVNLDFHCDDFSEWLLDNGFAPENVAFARSFPAEVCKFVPSKEIKQSPCPRNVASMFRWQQSGIKDLEVFTGCVGAGLATQYWAWMDVLNEIPSIDSILLNPDTEKVPDKPSHKYAVSSNLAHRMTPDNFNRAVTYLTRMEKMFEVSAVQDAMRLSQKKQGHPLSKCDGIVKWCTKNATVIC